PCGDQQGGHAACSDRGFRQPAGRQEPQCPAGSSGGGSGQAVQELQAQDRRLRGRGAAVQLQLGRGGSLDQSEDREGQSSQASPEAVYGAVSSVRSTPSDPG